MNMLRWLFDNCADDEWKGEAFYWRTFGEKAQRTTPALYSRLSMSNAHAVMFKLVFPEAMSVDILDPNSFNFSIYFIDDKKYQRTGLNNVDFWALPQK
jgi:hypothetical protein